MSTIRSGALMTAASALLFASKGVVVKCAYPYGVDAVTLLTLRMAFALPFFAAIAWWDGRGKPPLGARTTVAILGSGVLGYYLASLLDFEGLRHIDVALERTVLFLYPTLVVAIGAWRGTERLTARTALALVATYVGILLACGGGAGGVGGFGGSRAAAGQMWLGVVLVALSAVAYALFIVITPGLIRTIGSRRFMSIALIGACVTMIAHFAVTHPAADLRAPAPVIGYGVFLAVAATVIPALLMGEGMKRIGPQRFAIISSCGPVATVLLAWIVLAEVPTPIACVGMAITLAAGFAIGSGKASPASTPAPTTPATPLTQTTASEPR